MLLPKQNPKPAREAAAATVRTMAPGTTCYLKKAGKTFTGTCSWHLDSEWCCSEGSCNIGADSTDAWALWVVAPDVFAFCALFVPSLLGVPPDASRSTIKRAYLVGVRVLQIQSSDAPCQIKDMVAVMAKGERFGWQTSFPSLRLGCAAVAHEDLPSRPHK
jgi:hypothetical protein